MRLENKKFDTENVVVALKDETTKEYLEEYVDTENYCLMTKHRDLAKRYSIRHGERTKRLIGKYTNKKLEVVVIDYIEI